MEESDSGDEATVSQVDQVLWEQCTECVSAGRGPSRHPAACRKGLGVPRLRPTAQVEARVQPDSEGITLGIQVEYSEGYVATLTEGTFRNKICRPKASTVAAPS